MADRRRGLTRRRLLGAGGAGAAGAALGTVGLRSLKPSPARAQGDVDRPNVLLIVVDGLRVDFVSAYDDHDDRADTPNLDSLADDSLRFDRAIPEVSPAFPARRGILTGMRAYPFRDWQRTEGLAPYPGWNRVWNYQPTLTDVLRDGDVRTLYLSDNPLLEYERFKGVSRRPGGRAQGTQVGRYLAPVVPGDPGRDGEPPAARVVRSGIEALDELKGRQPFFLAVDVFDRVEATDPTPVYVRKTGRSRDGEDAASRADEEAQATYRPIEEIEVDDSADERVRDNYAEEVTAVDREIGRLLDKLDDVGLADSTVVYFVSATTMALGEHGVFGMAPAAGHEDVYRAACMIRDPEGRRKGDTSRFHAATPDIAPTVLSYMGLTIPGKMDGEDLTGLLDEDDVHPRPNFAIRMDEKIVVSDGRYVVIGDGDGRTRRLYDTDPDAWEDEKGDEKDFSPRDEDEDVAREAAEVVNHLWGVAVTAAGGTLPKLGPDGPIRPRPEIEDDDEDSEEDEGRLDRDDDLNFMGR